MQIKRQNTTDSAEIPSRGLAPVVVVVPEEVAPQHHPSAALLAQQEEDKADGTTRLVPKIYSDSSSEED